MQTAAISMFWAYKHMTHTGYCSQLKGSPKIAVRSICLFFYLDNFLLRVHAVLASEPSPENKAFERRFFSAVKLFF